MLTVAYATGVHPDKWVRRWRERFSERLTMMPSGQEAVAASVDEGMDQGSRGQGLDRGQGQGRETRVGDAAAADLVLLRLPAAGARATDRHRVVRLYDEDLGVAVSRDHPAALLGAMTEADVAEETAVRPGDALGGYPIDSFRAAIALAATGAGVAVAPVPLLRTESRKDVVVVPLNGAAPETCIAAVWPADLPPEEERRIQDVVGVLRGRRRGSSR